MEVGHEGDVRRVARDHAVSCHGPGAGEWQGLTPDEIRPLIGVLARTLFRAYAKGDQLTALVARI